MRSLGLLLLFFAACSRPSGPAPYVAPAEPRREEVDKMIPTPTSLVLYAIAPEEPRVGQPTFHGYPVLAEHVLRTDTHAAIMKLVRDDIVHGSEKALCFWPRHALRVQSDDAVVDLLICYECTTVEVHRDGRQWHVPIEKSARVALDQILTERGFVRPPESGRRYTRVP